MINTHTSNVSPEKPIQTRPSHKFNKLLYKDGTWAFIMLLPNLIGFLMFILIPVIATFVISFMDYDIVSPMKFVGLQNYIEMFKDPIVHQTLRNTLVYTVTTVPVGMVFSLILAVVLDQKVFGRRFYRAVYFLPSITSMVAIAVVWQWIYNPEFGLLNYILSLFGLKGPSWLSSSATSLLAIAIVGIWKSIGYNMLLFLAGLQGISETYYEAAKLDGANPMQEFFYITIPLLSPTTFFIFIMSIIGSFQVFDSVILMTNGGPGRSSSVLVQYLYENAFKYFRMGYACSIAYLLFFVVLIVTAINLRVEKNIRNIY
ncbi:carbohydrate ABC transporter permease [Cellulosilyticum sp. I15G10I2]|uniref:carbohydrate ABC transporter permease n=1 Tax=Cellulosilyticum sp. I15G10I2 TaxID=1892843 RepID=UPI0009F551B9|nr:sugar ABC transporter permease [Cellulosilyticum sp. I15G10I2]